MLEVSYAKYISGYKIEITFSDKRSSIVDFKEILFNEERLIFKPLRDISYFQKFKVDYTIIWENGLDLAPEFLYFKAFQNDEDLQEQFKEWGYAA